MVRAMDFQSRGCQFQTTGSKVDSAFYHSEVDEMSIRNPWGLSAQN